MHNILFTIFMYDVKLAFRKGGQTLHVFAFFAVVVLLFALAAGPEPQKLQTIGSSVLWVSILLAITLGLPSLFQQSYEDGSLEQLLLLDVSLEWIVAAKCLASWVVGALPLIIISPILALMLQLPPEHTQLLIESLLLGTPTITCMGALGAALVLGNKRAGVLLSLLIMPLYIPVLIFGSGTVSEMVQNPDIIAASFKILLALLLTVPILWWVTAKIIRGSIR